MMGLLERKMARGQQKELEIFAYYTFLKQVNTEKHKELSYVVRLLN